MGTLEELIQRAERFVEQDAAQDATGHDYWHSDRVRQISAYLAEQVGADRSLCELAALLHDVADWKRTGEEDPCWALRPWLEAQGAGADLTGAIIAIVKEVSFKGAGVPTVPPTLEGKVVQDADRLDALGAIGIARTFAYGGAQGRALYDPRQHPVLHGDFVSYRSSQSSSLHHFYEKMLLLRDRMHTEPARKIAERRHRFLEQFLDQFFLEWNVQLD